MRRREFIALLGGAAVAAGLRPLEARAQGSTKPRRIGVLSQDLAGAHPMPVFHAFLDGLRELGWLEGHNLSIEWRFSEGSLEPLPRLAAELVALPVELIVASPARPARVAKEATNTIPVVFIQVPDPVALGIVTNLARPGANVTGFSSIASDLTGKRLALVKEVLPAAMKIALLWNRPSEGSALVFQEMNRIKGQVGLDLEDIGISDGRELQEAFASAVRTRVAAVIVIDDPLMTSRRTKVAQLAAEHGLPVFSQYRGCRWPDFVWTEAHGDLPARCHLRRSYPQGHQAERAAGGATYRIRDGHQSANSQVAWPRASADEVIE
jgi:putative tryptophan/tyrosine transport system substrate-binding protein